MCPPTVSGASVGGSFAREYRLTGEAFQDGYASMSVSLSVPTGHEMTGTAESWTGVVYEPTETDQWCLTADFTYGLNALWAMRFTVPFVSLEVEDPSLSYSSLADPEIHLSRRLADSPVVIVSAGVSLPMADTNVQTDEGTRAADLLQPGRGTISPLLGGSVAFDLPASLSIFADLSARFGLQENDYAYKFGHAVDITGGIEKTLGPAWILGIDLSLSHTEPDEEDGAPVINTGGNVLYATPAVGYRWDDRWSVRIVNQVRVAEDVDGQQMLPRQNLAIGMAVSF